LTDLADKAAGCLQKKPDCPVAKDLRDVFLDMAASRSGETLPGREKLKVFQDRLEAVMDKTIRDKAARYIRDA
jgi:hypothetical protein